MEGSLMHKQNRMNNSETIDKNEKESPASVIKQSEVKENETVANKSKQYTKQNIGDVQFEPKAESSQAEGSKCQLTEKGNSICQTNEKKVSKCEPKDKNVSIDQAQEKVVSKYQPRDKVVSFNNDQKNNEGEERSNNNLEGKKGQNKGNEDKNKIMFKKKEGTAQVSGQFYEINMISYIFLGVKFDQDITNCYFASNIGDIGALDDICFRFKSNDNDKDVLVFIQTKHRNQLSEKTNITMNDVRKSDGDYSLKKYFNSFLKIREKIISQKEQNYMFEGDNMNNLDCCYIIYTPAGHSIDNNNIKLDKPSSKVNTLIETAGDGVIFQLKYEPVAFLLHDLPEKRFEELAKNLLDIILNGNMNMINDELVEKYRTVLLYDVIDISEDFSEGTHKGKFRSDFFDNNEIYTTMFREKLYNEVIKNELRKFSKDKENLALSTHDDSVAPNMSKKIGNIIRYDNKSNKFSVIDDSLLNCGLFDQVKEENKPTSAKDVVEMAGKEILKSLEFNIPDEFIKKDMQIRNSRRLIFLTNSVIKLFKNAKDQNGVKLIEIDENMFNANNIKHSVFDQNGGLGSAVGNLLKIDQDSKTFKFDTENLPLNAAKLWENLNLKENLTKIKEDLMSYRFKICIEGFPKVSIEDVNFDEYLVKDFLSKLWFYTGQAKHDTVEELSKKMIKNHLKADSMPESIFEVSTDAVYLIFLKTVIVWWESDEAKEYLTKSTTILDDAVSLLMNNPILTVLNLFCVNTLKTIGIEFNKDAMKSLNLDELTSGLVMIITDSTLLTGAKLNQYFSDSHGHIFVNWNYVINHFSFSFEKILHELESKIIKTIVIICEKMESSINSIQALKHLKLKMHARKIIIVSTKKTHEEINKDMECTDVRNDTNNLCDLSLESQEKVLNESIVIFQGVEVNLKTIIDNDSKHIITSQILHKLVNKELFEIGKALTTSNYEDIKQFYIHRTIEWVDEAYNHSEDHNHTEGNVSDSKNKIVLDIKNLLEGLKDDVMVITAPPGMGKSTLFTHLSVETMKKYPKMWIARINLLDHSSQFDEWKRDDTVIDKKEIFFFLCKAVLTNGNRIGNIEFADVNNDIALKRDSVSVEDSLELDFFIYCCKTGNVIFLFDGLDEICPEYESKGIELIKSTFNLINNGVTTGSAAAIRKPKIWIASRCYNDIKTNIEREFGKPYNLQPLSAQQQKMFLKAFWKEHLKIDKFTNKQLDNVKRLIIYMHFHRHHIENRHDIDSERMPFYNVYVTAVNFILKEIKSNPILLNKQIFDDTLSYGSLFFFKYRVSTPAGTPLYLYLAAEYFQNEFKRRISNETNKWNLKLDTFSFTEYFFKTKLSKILQEGKNKIDLYIPDNKKTNESKYKTFLEQHQKLAFYTIFCYSRSFKALIADEELAETKTLIKSFEFADEKTGVIDGVVNGIPRFEHRTFAEYFAVQHVFTLLKAAYYEKKLGRQVTLWKFILEEVLNDSSGLYLNHILANDDDVTDVILNEDTERIVYDIISEEIQASESLIYVIIPRAITFGQRELLKIVLTCIKKHIKKEFIHELSEYVHENDIIYSLHKNKYHDLLDLLMKILTIVN